ncbi:MAG: metalloregulator ArsR/SmtB family transcription factor [Chitinophagales bacterium]
MAALNQHNLDYATELLRAIAHPLRLSIIEFIDKNGIINVNKIYNTLNLEQSITSQHLRILRNAEVVETRREGKYIYYTLNYEKIEQLKDALASYQISVKERGIKV